MTTTFGELIEKHPITVLATIAVSVGGVVAGIVTYFSSQHVALVEKKHEIAIEQIEFRHSQAIKDAASQHSQALEDLEGRLRGIERRLGGQKFLDIEKLLRDGGSRSPKDAQLKYHPDGRYYAATDSKRWKEEKVHEADIHAIIAGSKKEDLFSPSVLEHMSKINTRIWRGSPDFHVSNSTLIKSIFPYIMVQCIPYHVFPGFFERHQEKLIQSSKKDHIGSDVIDKESLNAVNVLVHSDATGIFATRKLAGIMNASTKDPNITYNLRNIQKNGPVLYVQVVYELRNATVNGTHKGEFYIVNEWILLAREKDLFAIEIVNPALEPGFEAGSFIDANLWLGSFYLARQ
jgi:hypothetical protein